MLEALSGFLELLRARGLAVSPAEALEATRAIEALGVEDRERMRSALGMTLIKRSPGRRVFNEAFDRYFLAPLRIGGAARAKPAREAGAGPARLPRPDGEAGRPLARRGEKREVKALPLASELSRQARRHDERLRRVILTRPEDRRRHRGSELRRRELRVPATAAEDRALVEETVKLLSELRLRPGRRREPDARGRFAPRRTLRASLATGGVPFAIRRERRRRRRPRLVLLMDVSRSVERAASLFLMLAAGLIENCSRARIFAFVDRPVECTREILAWARGGRAAGASGAAFTSALAGVAGLDLKAASDYGRAFFALASQPPAGRDGVLVVLGDGRINRFEPLAWAFADLARRPRAVLWLVPERHEQWGTGDSALGTYLPHADVAVETADLHGLARGLGQLGRMLRGKR